MSDDAASDVSDAELDVDFADFDPLAVSDDEEDAPAAPPDDESDDESDDGGPGRDRDAPIAPPPVGGTRAVIVVALEERVTSNVMTLAEVTRAIAFRAQQISKNPTAYIEISGDRDEIAIARRELLERRSPLRLRRAVGVTPAGESVVEIWRVREMSYPPLN